MRLLLLVMAVFALGGCAAQSKSRRAEQVAQRADTSLREAERAMRALNVDAAEDALEEAKEALGEDVLDDHPEASLLRERYRELVPYLDVAKREKEKRELALAVERQRQNLERARTRLLNATDALDAPDVGGRRIGEVESAMDTVEDALEEGKAFEAQDVPYADDAAHARRRLERAKDRVELAKKRVAFAEGPSRAAHKGAALLAEAKKQKALDERQESLLDARRELHACTQEGAALLGQHAELANAAILHGEKAATPAKVIASCEKSLKSADALLARTQKAIDRAKKKKAAVKKKRKATVRKKR